MAKKVTEDERFANVHSDPRFKLPKRRDFKVEVDDRFKKADLVSLKKKAKVDKYGRRTQGEEKLDFEKYYKKKEESDDDDDDDENESESGEEADVQLKQSESEEQTETEDGLEEDPASAELDRARGGAVSVVSSSDESSSDEESSEDEGESEIELEESKPETGDPSCRFAVVNMDWDHVQSVDLFATFQSFVPSDGLLKSVTVFPSEFGKERMQREELEGPPKELFSKHKNNDDSDSELEAEDLYQEGDADKDYDSKSLRRYQLQRLRYYYAVVECDSTNTAMAIYKNVDGTEYESTANFFDLRYIPDDMTFDDEARDTCDKVPSHYKPDTFVTDALQHSKVKLTWDETPAERTKLSSKSFSQRELDDMDFKAYLASDNSEDEEQEEMKNKYQRLLGASTKIDGKDLFKQEQSDDEGDIDKEITFTPAGETNADDEKNSDEESTLDKLKRKSKERRQARKEKIKQLKQQELEEKKEQKAEKTKKKGKQPKVDEKARADLELLMMDEDGKKKVNADHFSLKELVRSEKEKGKKTKHRNKSKIIEDDFTPDLNDSRFNEIFTSHEFAIDPSQPQFQKTATMQKILDERNKRRDGEQAESKETKSKKRKLASKDDDVKSLAQKIKRKAGKQ